MEPAQVKRRNLPEFGHPVRPAKFCNTDRMFEVMEQRGIDGFVSYYDTNVYYFSGFTPSARHALQEANGLAAIVLSRHAPDHPIMLVGDQQFPFFLNQPTWITDIRAYAGGIRQLDLPDEHNGLHRFLPKAWAETEAGKHAAANYYIGLKAAVMSAITDLGLGRGRVATDNLSFAGSLDLPDAEIVDGYGMMKFVRSVKTAEELTMLRQATRINQLAIERTAAGWEKGQTWQEINHSYFRHAVELGGFVRGPSPLAVANPLPGEPDALLMQSLREMDYVIPEGAHIVIDGHGEWLEYCWDGGKTWIAGNEPTREGQRVADACGAALEEINAALVPGSTVSGLQALGRDVLRRHGLPRPEAAFIYFHGMGLEHGELEAPRGGGYTTGGALDWRMEKGMVVATHIFYPGDIRTRHWLEDITLVTDHGGETFFTWGTDFI
ncbi:M24 family metallopeptidase [Nonomuraea sp. NPDC049486]|uniref:M24 family metallopeptidase n=1 Tax=Nonomuraea sp. NPDC049486 TaxID=3155773 RepID=UPI00342CD016